MPNYNGSLSAAQLITTMDGLSAIFDAVWPTLGLGLTGEVGTGAIDAAALKTALLGDGTSANPGIGNVYAQNVAGACDSIIARLRWDALFANAGRLFVTSADAQVQNNVPPGWLMSGGTNIHYLDNHLSRLNGCHAGVPTTPPSIGVLTATNVAGGDLPDCVIGNGPRVVHTLGGTNEWDESLPSGEAAQVAIAGANNAYSYQIPGVVPAGVTWVKTYRGFVGGATGIYSYDQKVTAGIVAGSAYPAIIIQRPDYALLTDWTPPAWLSCLFKPTEAFLVAIAYALAGAGGVGFGAPSATGVQNGRPLAILLKNMLSPANVVLGPSNAFLGIGNNTAPQSAVFGTTVIGTGYTAGTLQTANNDASGLQGFAGATKLQARITSVCNAAPTVNITYSYLDAAHGQTLQTGGTATATFGAAVVGTVIPIPITAGRLVKAVPADAPSGAVSGTYIIEAAPIR